MATNTENITGIVQHRRGKTADWAHSTIIPYEGELVIEECADGTCRCKIGDGINTFEYLSYVDATTEASISTLQAQVEQNSFDINTLNTNVSNLKREVTGIGSKVQSMVAPSIEKLDAIYSAKLEAIETQHSTDITELHDILDKNVKDLTKSFEAGLSAQQSDVVNIVNTKVDDASLGLSNEIDKVKADLQKRMVDIAGTNESNKAAIESINNILNLTGDSLSTSIDKIYASELKISELIEEVTKLKELGYGDIVTSEMIGQLRTVEVKVEQLVASDIDNSTQLISVKNSLNNITRQLKELKDLHSTDLGAIKNSVASLKTELGAADAEMLTKINGELAKLWTEITDLIDDDIVLYDTFAITRNELTNKVAKLKSSMDASITSVKKELNDTIDSKEAALKNLVTTSRAEVSAELTSAKAELTDNINSVKSACETTAKATTASIKTVQNDIVTRHTELVSKIAETEAALDQHRVATESNFNSVDNKIIDINKKLIATDARLTIDQERLDSQAKQISQLVRLEDGSTTGDAELANARIGFEGKEHESVGEYIRELEGSIRQHIGADAITGLHYDTEGEVGLQQPYMLYLKNADGEILSDTGVQIISGAGGGTGGGSSTSSLKIEYITVSPVVVTKADKVVLRFNFSGVDSSGDEILQANAAWKINGETREYGVVNAGENEFDVTKYLKVGTTKVFLTVTDDNGRVVTKQWSVQQLDLSVQSYFDDKLSYHAGEDIIFTYVPYGAVDKTAVFVLDGEELARVKLQSGISGTEQKYQIPAQSHGAHLLEVYLEAEINGKTAASDSIVKDILWYDPESDLPIIGAATQKFYAKQYATTNIVYTVYDKSTETPEVSIEVNGSVVDINTVSANAEYGNTPTAVYSFVTDTVGTHTIKILCRGAEKIITVVVDELGINATPITAGLAFDFNPVGRTNGSNNRFWSHNGVSLRVSDNFDWTNGGYLPKDPDGPCFCIKAGSYATIDYKLFADDAKKYGKEFKLVFKTKNVANPNAVFLSCMDNTTAKNHIGIQMGVHNANIYGQSGNLELAYSEEDIIEFEFNISKSTDAVPMVMGYEDGVPSRPMVYNDTFEFKQNTPKEITLGSADCDLHIYRFKVYNTSLTAEEILHNFIADARTAEEMISRYNRNQIYDENHKLDPYVLAEKCPWLRVYIVSAPHFTNNKSDKVPNTTIQQLYKAGDPIYDNWICYNAQHSGQGTSSNNYGAAGRNLDFIMNNSGIAGVEPYIILGDGNTAVKDEDKIETTKITLTRKSVPVDYLNAKVNIASSNNLTNAILAKRYNEFKPYTRNFIREDPSIIPFIKDTMEFHNCVIFIQETDPDLTTHREFADTDWHFYAIGNIGDSKKTDKTRKTDIADRYECCVEIMDVELPLSDFPVDTMIDAMGYEEDETTHERTYIWAKDENLGILYEAQFAVTTDEEINLSKTYYIDLPEIIPATAEQQTIENIENLYERLYVLTEDSERIKDKVYYMDAEGTLATKEYLQDIENPKAENLYEWRREYQKTDDTEIIANKFYYVSVLKKTNAMAYTYEEVKNYIWAKDENLDQLYEIVDGEYTKTLDEKVDLNKTYYIRIEEKDKDDNIIGTNYLDAMGYATERVKVYTYANAENLAKGNLYEIACYPTTDAAVDLTKTYYVDVLEHDDFSEDFTYGWRYISDKKDPTVVNVCKQAWIDFYRFVTRSTDEEFKANFEDYFVKSSALYNYLFTTRYCMVDNRAKNTFWHFGKTGNYHIVAQPNAKLLPIYCELIDGNYVLTQDTAIDQSKTYYSQYAFDLYWDYDNDTSLGLNNYGAQVYRYGLEDTDLDEAGREIFREMDSTFFCRVRDCFAPELQDMYNTLESKNAWHAESFIKDCDDWQNEFPEELWRLDIDRKYIRTYTSSFINGKGDSQFLVKMANGRMKYHRRQWERSQEQYMASKYQTSTAANDNSVFRCEVPDGVLAVQPDYRLNLTPYAYMYLNVKYGTGNPIKVRATNPNKPVLIPFTAAGTDIISIYSASLIQDFGDLSTCYPQTADTSRASRIRKLTLGNVTEGYENPGFESLTTGANPLLEELDVSNVTGLKQSLDLQALINLKKLYAFGTNVPSVLFADGGKLEYVELPAINNITLKNLPNLSSANFNLASYDNVTDLAVDGCPLINIVDLLTKCINVNRVRLIGVDFGNVAYNEFKARMFNLKGLTANGEETANAWLVGKIHFTDELLTGAQYNEITSRYPNLEVTYEKLESQLQFIQVDGETEYTEAKQVIINGGNGIDPVSAGSIQTPYKESNDEFEYEFVSWSTNRDFIIGENQLADKEALDNKAFNEVEGDRVLYPVFKAIRRSYEVVFINPNTNGDAIELQRVKIPYGNTIVYTGQTPVKLDPVASVDLYSFIGWCDSLGNIINIVTSDLVLYAQFAVLDATWWLMQPSEIQAGYSLDALNSTITIFKYNNPYNKAVKVPATLTIDGTAYTVSGVGGFLGNTMLELVSIPNTATEISYTNNTQQGAFEGCSNLVEITLPQSIQKIGNKAFFGCNRLSEVAIPANVSSIGRAAFAECSNLSTIAVDSNNKYYIVIDNCLIEKSTNTLIQALPEAVIPDTVQNLGAYCFAKQPVVSIALPEGISTVASNAFNNCSELTTVHLPNSMRVLDATCFSGCKKLVDINLPDGLTTIRTYIFNECALETVTIPSTVTSLGTYSFGNMVNLKSVTFRPYINDDGSIRIPDIDDKAFMLDSGKGIRDKIVFNLPWSEEDHATKFGSVANAWGATKAEFNFNYVEG